jgi:hypothetical protein
MTHPKRVGILTSGQVEAVQIEDVVAHSPLPVDPNGALVQTARRQPYQIRYES